MVALGVERPQSLPGEVRDVGRLPAGVEAVGGGGVQGLVQAAAEQGVGVGHVPLHLVVDHPLDHQGGTRVVGLGELQAVTLLAEVQLAQQGEEGGVQVDAHQVVEVGAVLTGERVQGPVVGGQRVHEGAQRALEHGEERVAHRVAPGTAQHGVFQDVGCPRGVPGRRAKTHGEQVVVVGGGQVQPTGVGGGVFQAVEGGIELRQGGHLLQAEPVSFVADVHLDLCHHTLRKGRKGNGAAHPRREGYQNRYRGSDGATDSNRRWSFP